MKFSLNTTAALQLTRPGFQPNFDIGLAQVAAYLAEDDNAVHMALLFKCQCIIRCTEDSMSLLPCSTHKGTYGCEADNWCLNWPPKEVA